MTGEAGLRTGALWLGALLAALVLAPGVAAEPGAVRPEGDDPVALEGAGGLAAVPDAGQRDTGPPEPAAAALGPVERVWQEPGFAVVERAKRARRSALEHGTSLDGAARALLADGGGGDPLEVTAAALWLAPDLPAVHMARARALWLHGEAPMAALREAGLALFAVPRHLEAALWFAGSLLTVLALALVTGGLACLVAAGGFAAAHALHDLGDVVAPSAPAFARAALLAALLLAPLALGEGVLGLALGFCFLGVTYGGARQRLVLALAAAAVVAGAFPVARLAGATLSAWSADPVADAAYRVAAGGDSPVDLARLEAASDPLAARALARHARRSGALGRADARYQDLLERFPEDPVVANNAANVRLRLGHLESALDLYHQSASLALSPIVLFNLSQAHGRAFQVDDLGETLAMAQALDATAVAELTELQGAATEDFVVDLPLPAEPMWRRVLASEAGEGVAARLRSPVAPGRLGEPRTAGAAFALAIVAASLLGSRFSPSRWCDRCGRRQCPRCDGKAGGEQCESCTALFQQPESADRALRLARIAALRRREQNLKRASTVASILVPGAAGWLAKRPLLSLAGALFAAGAVFLVLFRGGVAPDPLVAGPAASLAFLGAAAACAFCYAAVVALSVAAHRGA